MRSKFALIGVFALVAGALAQDAVKLEWKPQTGRTLRYKLVIVPEMPGMEMKITMDLSSTPKEIRKDGKIVVESAFSAMKMVMNGQEMDGPASSETMVMMPNGEMAERKATGDMDNPRLSEALVFIFPDKAVKPGDTWKRSRAKNAIASTPASETTYTYVGDEVIGGIKTRKLSFSFKETEGANPMSASGTLWLDAADGELVRGENTILNMEFAPGASGNAKTTITRAG